MDELVLMEVHNALIAALRLIIPKGCVSLMCDMYVGVCVCVYVCVYGCVCIHCNIYATLCVCVYAYMYVAQESWMSSCSWRYTMP
jgi:hypothetical protein